MSTNRVSRFFPPTRPTNEEIDRAVAAYWRTRQLAWDAEDRAGAALELAESDGYPRGRWADAANVASDQMSRAWDRHHDAERCLIEIVVRASGERVRDDFYPTVALAWENHIYIATTADDDASEMILRAMPRGSFVDAGVAVAR